VPDPTAPWFADKQGEFVVFRVNRRPIGEHSLLPAEPPEDVFEHFVRVLTPGWEVVTGRRHQRTWRVGGVDVDSDRRVVTGKLGWLPRGEEVVAEWSDEDKDWIANVAAPHGGRILPFGFDGDSRLLAVLRDGASAPTTISGVFEKILRENERELTEPTTEWSLDRRDFLTWLDKVDVVHSVSFTAKLPNPEPREDFAELVARMERRHATHFTETLASKTEEGLVGVQHDPDIRQAVAMGTQGFATLRGKGSIGGTVTKYSQREVVAEERVDVLPDSWDDMRELITGFLKHRLRRFLERGDEAA
jgi:hypothetical protein